jgi:hypothetical protein
MKKLEVIDLHNKFFKHFEFEFHPTYMLYRRAFAQGQQVIFIHYTENSEATFLEYSLGVRIHAVEEIIHKFLPSLSDYSERSITLVQTPDKIDSTLPRRFEIENEGQLTDSIVVAEDFFVTKGFDWLNEMIDPHNLEKAFAFPKDEELMSQNFVYNSFRGVTLAKLFNEEDYPYLRNKYLDQIRQKEMTPFTIASFLQLLDYLDKLDD